MTEPTDQDSAWIHAGMDLEPDRTQEYGQDLEHCDGCDRQTRRPGETKCRTCRLEDHDARTELADQAHADVTAVQQALGGGPPSLTYDEWVAAGRPTRPRGEDGRLVPSDPPTASEDLDETTSARVVEMLDGAGSHSYYPEPVPLAPEPGPLVPPAIGDRRRTLAGNEWFDGRNWRRVPDHPAYAGDRVFPETAVRPLAYGTELGSAVAGVLEAWTAITDPMPSVLDHGWRRDQADPSFARLFDALDVLRGVDES